MVEATWPAIIDRKDWEQIGVILNNPARRTNGPNVTRRSYLLSGLLTVTSAASRWWASRSASPPQPTQTPPQAVLQMFYGPRRVRRLLD